MTTKQFVSVARPVEIAGNAQGLAIKCQLYTEGSANNSTEFIQLKSYFFMNKYVGCKESINLVGVINCEREYLIDEEMVLSAVVTAMDAALKAASKVLGDANSMQMLALDKFNDIRCDYHKCLELM